MLEIGSGFFGMWNGIAPEQAADFPLMHTRDHVPEHLVYLGREGMTWARRYHEGVGDLPPFFTMYAMPTLDRIGDPAVANAKAFQTEWFKSMRPHYRDRLPMNCRVLASAGAGMGSAVATLVVDLAQDAQQAGARLDLLVDGLTRLAPITAAHLGLADWRVPIHVGGEPEQGEPGTGVLVLEGFSRFSLAAAIAEVSEALIATGTALRVRATSHYALSYGLAYEEIADLRHFRRDDALVAMTRRQSADDKKKL